MITFDAFLVFLIAASIPVAYIFIVRHIIEGGQPSSNVASQSRIEKQQKADLISPCLARTAVSH
ncbi:hypothetical protein N9B57_01660 [Verrucomicrobia bacterium]|jgi:hypothetical protein|nr:hypothetical protein [Verrucomicrobiota bacterium]MDA7866618.1 hypothetical protein [Verrucomicrobiota bacterium]